MATQQRAVAQPGDAKAPASDDQEMLDAMAEVMARQATVSHAEATLAGADRRQLLLPVSDNYFCRFQPCPSSRPIALITATTLG
jgi:hypothetical protein